MSRTIKLSLLTNLFIIERALFAITSYSEPFQARRELKGTGEALPLTTQYYSLVICKCPAQILDLVGASEYSESRFIFPVGTSLR